MERTRRSKLSEGWRILPFGAVTRPRKHALQASKDSPSFVTFEAISIGSAISDTWMNVRVICGALQYLGNLLDGTPCDSTCVALGLNSEYSESGGMYLTFRQMFHRVEWSG